MTPPLLLAYNGSAKLSAYSSIAVVEDSTILVALWSDYRNFEAFEEPKQNTYFSELIVYPLCSFPQV